MRQGEKFVPKYSWNLSRKEKHKYLEIRHNINNWHSHPANETCAGEVARHCAKSPFYRSGEPSQ